MTSRRESKAIRSEHQGSESISTMIEMAGIFTVDTGNQCQIGLLLLRHRGSEETVIIFTLNPVLLKDSG